MPAGAQAQYRAIFDYAFEAIAVIDTQGDLVLANPAVQHIFLGSPSSSPRAGHSPSRSVACAATAPSRGSQRR